VGRAVEVAFELVAVTALELDTALFATEMARMHELTFDKEVGANDGLVAHGALMRFGADHAHFFLHASRAINVFRVGFDLVALSDKVRTTADTNEVLRVE